MYPYQAYVRTPARPKSLTPYHEYLPPIVHPKNQLKQETPAIGQRHGETATTDLQVLTGLGAVVLLAITPTKVHTCHQPWQRRNHYSMYVLGAETGPQR